MVLSAGRGPIAGLDPIPPSSPPKPKPLPYDIDTLKPLGSKGALQVRTGIIIPPATHPPVKPTPKKTAQKIVSKSSGGGSGGNSGGGLPGGIALPGALPVGTSTPTNNSDLLKRATESISAQMDPQLAEYKNEINDATKSGAQQSADLAELYRRLGVSQAADTAAGQAVNAKTMQDVTGRYNQLLGALGNDYSGATGQTNAELNRLGIQAVAPQATQRLNNDAIFQNSVAQNDKAFAQTVTESKSQTFDNLLKTIQSQGQLSGTQKVAAVKAAAAQTIADLSNKKGALAATRKGAVDALYQQLVDARTKSQVDQAQQNFMNQIALGKLGIAQGTLGVAQQNANSNADLRTSEVRKNESSTAINAFKLKNPNGTIVKLPSGSSTQLKGATGGLQLIGQLPVSKSLKDLASSLFTFYTQKYGGTVGWKKVSAGKDVHFNSLPDAVKLALKDAFTLAGS